MKHQDQLRRVVITGMGVIAANGQDLDTFWKSIRDGKSAGRFLTRFDCTNIPSKVAAEIMDFDPARYIDPKHAKRLDRSLQYSVSAAHLAAKDAGIDFTKINPDRTGVIEGTSLSNNVSAYETQAAYLKKGYRGVGVSALINGYSGSGCGEIANELGVKGHAITCSTSSSSGNDAMGYALSMIRHEDVDVMIAGGAEAPFIESVWSIFCLNKVMTRHSDDPAGAMRPFDKTRDGFMLGEGAAYVVLEELAHALGRGARIYAEVLSHGRSCEAYHALAQHPDGIGVTRALEKAIGGANIHPSEVDYINAHGTATTSNDVVETRGIQKFFGEYASNIAISSTKPVTGHLMAGAGAIETVICALALCHQEIPMTLNLKDPDEECGLDYVAGKSRPYPLKIAVNLNSGFGGKNSCLVLRRYPPDK
jgi:3-oxoacyl-[acyl-carrier-protein] synthase II